MKKNLLFIIILVSSISLQGQQMQNASFEDWEDAGTVIDEPVNWSSIKTSDAGSLINNAAPVVWGQSDDAHTGNYSIELTNVLTLGTIIATGTVTSGRIHASFNPAEAYSFTDTEDPRWNTPITDRPDSVAVWIKYYPQGDDTAQVKVILHTGEGSIPETPENVNNRIAFAQINVAGEHDVWTRVAAPFTYFSQGNPEFALMILTAGAGLLPVTGSIALYDDVELIYDPSGVNQLSLESNSIYSYGSTLYLDKVLTELLKGAQIELINMNGSTVWSSPVTSSRMNIQPSTNLSGIFVVRLIAADGVYSQKIFLE